MWEALAALAAVAAAWIAIIVGRATTRAQTRSTLDQRAPNVTVMVDDTALVMRHALANGWGIAHSSWDDHRFTRPWCLAKPGALEPLKKAFHGDRPNDGDMQWAVVLPVLIHNHSARSVSLESSALVSIAWPEGQDTPGVVASPSTPATHLTIGPNEQIKAWLPVQRSMRDWAALSTVDGWEEAGTIVIDDGQDYGVAESRAILAQLRPVAAVGPESDPHGPHHCEGCGEGLWRIRGERPGPVKVAPAVRSYFFSKRDGLRVPQDGPSWPGWLRRLRRRD